MFDPYLLIRIKDEVLRLKTASLLLAFCLISALVWWYGPYLGLGQWQPLASQRNRWLAIVTLFLVWMGWWAVSRALGTRRQKRMAEQMQAGAADPERDSRQRADQEHARLRARFVEATTLLRKRRKQGFGLDTVPWYLLIGAPGSGKSTLLRHSGLEFPLQDKFGGPVQGVGGTRSCDWWFSDQAVFLDSAGRYTTQDSDATADAAAWQGFLKLLRRYRRKPLNGIIVTVSARDLLEEDQAIGLAHARAVRARLDELGEQLRATVPVYLLVTKLDMVSGFSDFFGDLDTAARGQVWGASFDNADRGKPCDPVESVRHELDLLLERVDARVIERLHAGRDVQRRAAMLSFPQQLRLLQPALAGFIQTAFSAHGYAAQPWLRGMYLTSGTQEGHPVDRVLSAVARHFGIAPAALPPALGQPRTFFVSRLLHEVVFAESGLAGGGLARWRRLRTLQMLAWTGLTVSTLLLLSALLGSYAHNAKLAEEVRQALAPYSAEPLRKATTEQQYYAAAGQRFDILTQARQIALPSDHPVPWSARFGLFQGRSLAARIDEAYLRDLNGVLLPAFGQSVHASLVQASNAPQRLYQLLKVYLMLGEPEHRQVDQLAALASDYWRGVFPEDAAIRDALVRHLRALFQSPQGVRALSLDRQQVERSRASLRTAELPVLVYGAIRLALGNAGSEDGKRQGPRLDRQLGLLGEVYERRSGVPLSEPLPYLFTRAGFQELAGGGLDAAVRQFLADDWVLGSTQLDPLARSQLARQVMALYQRDYIQAWDGLLEDLQLRPVSGMAEASAVAAKLGGPGSPLKAMMELVQAHTSGLTSAPPAAPAAADKPAAAAEEGGGGAPAAAQPPDPLAAPIERHFEPINRLSVDGGGGTQLQQITSSLTQVGRSLLTMSAGAAGAGVDQNDPSLLLAAQQAQQLPMPLAGWISGLVGQSRTLVADNTGELLRSRQQQAAGQDCALFVNGRYPFRPDSRSDIPLRDFAELFGPGGRFDRFFQQALADKAQTSGRQWQWNRQMQDVSATDVLTRAQLADHVQQAFFAGGGAMPKVDFTASIASQAELGRIELEIDGQVLEAKGQAPASLSMSWPGPQSGQLRLSAWDTAGRPLPPVQYRGVWAMFRALDAGRLRAVGDLRYRADFEVGDAVVSVDIQPASLRHPFADTALQRFRCP